MREKRLAWFVSAASVALSISSTAYAQQALPSDRPTAGKTVGQQPLQQLFDDASIAVEKGDCAAALPIFERLAADSRVKKGSLPAATIDVRQGLCLWRVGKSEAAEQRLLAGLPTLRAAGQSMAVDVSSSDQVLGSIAIERRDRDAAVGHYLRALASLRGEERIGVLAKLAQVTQFDGDEVPLAYIEEALALTNKSAKPDRKSLIGIHTIRGRILLNQGRNKEALAELRQALSLSGGLTTSKISLAEAAMRGDLAQASLLTGDKDQARLYLAYTGAGRIEQSPFYSAASMDPPQCGPETGLAPNDVAIVEFGINDAGDVSGAQTVYARGNYQVASAFARAVEQWYWRPEALAKIPPFYKLLIRVEVRCSKSGGQLPSIMSPLQDRFGEWAKPLIGDISFDSARIGTTLERLKATAANQERDGNLAAATAALMARGIFNPSAGPEQTADLDAAFRLAQAAKIPIEAYNTLLVFRSLAAQRRTGYERRRYTEIASSTEVGSLINTYPTLAQDSLAEDTLILMWTRTAPPASQRDAAIAALSEVADDRRLSEHHPLRQVALLRLANLSASAGKLEEANRYFTRTGLSEEQCSLIGATPSLKSSGASDADFPMEALRFGFEGWVNLEFDINADGKTANARPVIAYPPFVFVEAATGISRDMRFNASYRPSNALACSASRQTIQFQIPK